ncbi:hypothetical protein FACS1894205_4970 [Alphaproteobacteria bacterium]|nr:hypothetical protein FACS1894205_4970 [Alphaproteobacteria bacterium]
MFSRGGKKGGAPASGNVLSVIAGGCRVVGDIDCGGEIQVDGAIEGDVKGKIVIVGENGSILGTISGELVRVLGSVRGQIQAGAVELARTACVVGDIRHDSLSVAAGAHVEGRFDRLSPPDSHPLLPARADRFAAAGRARFR